MTNAAPLILAGALLLWLGFAIGSAYSDYKASSKDDDTKPYGGSY